MKCQRCLTQPGYHSFERLADLSGASLFYCYPAHNTKSVRTHEDMVNFARHFPEEGPWRLLFHANGYGLRQMMPLPLALELGRLVQEKHLGRLQKVYIVEGSWFFTFVVQSILPFLRKEMRQMFVLVSGSLLEVIAHLEAEGIPLSSLSGLRQRFGKVEGDR